MLDKKPYQGYFYEDKDDPYSCRRNKYILDYPEDIEPPYVSDGDTSMLIGMYAMVDKQLDNYTIGVYYRLLVLNHFYRPWFEIYKYGSNDFIQKAIQKLTDEKYIEFYEDGNFKIL